MAAQEHQRGGDYREMYDNETRAKVAEPFAPDIERFGYSFYGQRS